MRRTKTGIVMVVAALAATVFTLSGPGPAGAAVIPSTAEVQFLSLLNQSRAASGLGPMVRDGGVDGVARAWSQSMAAVYAATGDPVVKPYAPNDCRQSALCHRPDLVTQVGAVVPQWALIGENIGTGFDVQSLHNSFMASGGHRANIMGNYNRVGIGVVTQGERIWVTFDFVNGPAIGGSTGNDAAVPVTPTGAQLPGPVVPLSARTRFNAMAPARVLDTRTGFGGSGLLAGGGTIRLRVAGGGLVPAGAGGVAINLTATESRGSGYLTVFPCAQGRPLASNLNVVYNATRANHTVVALDSSGYVCIFSSISTHVVADLAGWFSGSGSSYRPVTPLRVRDTRQSGGRVQNLVLAAGRPRTGRHHRRHAQPHGHRAAVRRLPDRLPVRERRPAERLEPQLPGRTDRAEPGDREARPEPAGLRLQPGPVPHRRRPGRLLRLLGDDAHDRRCPIASWTPGTGPAAGSAPSAPARRSSCPSVARAACPPEQRPRC